ncbi:MAG: class I poly(R)-hydroxyalkanoic acid synthase [Cellvibrionaceae bacterium]
MNDKISDAIALDYLEKFSKAFDTMLSEALARNIDEEGSDPNSPPFQNTQKIVDLVSKAIQVDTSKMMHDHLELMKQQVDLWQQTTKALMGEEVDPIIKEERGDHRFTAEDWNSHPVFSYMKQAYLLNSKMLENMVDSIEFDDHKTADKAKFYARQYINSVSPSNMAFTNPEVLQEIINTNGESLARGLDNFIQDIKQSPAEALKISQTDLDAFELGKNLATTPGEVVYQNELIQLLQYTPTTEQVYTRPLLFVPPFINKYYVLDLDEKKSIVKWFTDQGYTVYMISWVNPDAELAHISLDDYVLKGPVAAVDAIREITGVDSVNTAGYCVGGTTLSIAQAYLLAKGKKTINSMTLFTTLLDFEDPGEVGLYISENIVPVLERNIQNRGVFDGRIMGFSFSMLRENSLFWSYFVNNYLKGKKPKPFDILYWNSDATNIPAETFRYYLHKTYLDNELKTPGGVEIDGVPIDLNIIDTPTYYLATIADHIVLWSSAYDSAKLFSGPKKFVLAGSGHLAGVINSPNGGKYPHWTNDALPETAEEWKEGATEVEGSWWPDWHQWLEPQSGEKIEARVPGDNDNFPSIEPAPGSYVKVRI